MCIPIYLRPQFFIDLSIRGCDGIRRGKEKGEDHLIKGKEDDLIQDYDTILRESALLTTCARTGSNKQPKAIKHMLGS